MPYRHIEDRARDRFWRRVNKNGPNGCWLWTGSRDHNGYAKVGWRGHYVGGHRLAWMLVTGAWPTAELDLCHSCDVPACVNPSHLFEGTTTDNMQDAKAKGRNARGDGHGRSRLTESSVRSIREEWERDASPGRGRALAHQFGVSQQQISKIVLRQKWAHV